MAERADRTALAGQVGVVSMMSMDEEEQSAEAKQCLKALKEGKRCRSGGNDLLLDRGPGAGPCFVSMSTSRDTTSPVVFSVFAANASLLPLLRTFELRDNPDHVDGNSVMRKQFVERVTSPANFLLHRCGQRNPALVWRADC